MKIYKNPSIDTWSALCKRPKLDTKPLFGLIQEIFDTIQKDGDAALRAYSKKFDGVELTNFKVDAQSIENSNQQISPQLQQAIQQAYQNIYTFHKTQLANYPIIETSQGVQCWQENRAIERVGLYIPGGSAPLFSTVLMLGIPAKIAGCQQIVLCSPPNKSGKLHPAILYAAKLIGIQEIYTIGGAQAIGAMTFGTESIPQVYKIFGPGNQYVTAAKQLAQLEGIAIDMPAGPSELLVLADNGTNPDFVASDLLSQAEHGPDSQVICVATSQNILAKVQQAVLAQLEQLPRKAIAKKALESARFIEFTELEQAFKFINYYAPEHFIVAIKDAKKWINSIQNAGSVFLGNYTPESAGDYASGTNHTLPTNGAAKAYSGVNVDAFIKKITFQSITPKGLQNLGETIMEMAKAEELEAHRNAVAIRLEALKNNIITNPSTADSI